MINQKVEDILVKQIAFEMYSSNLYLSMASWAEQNGFGGVAKWMLAQSQEEVNHSLKFVSYVNSRGGKAIIPALSAPQSDFADIKELFEETLKHEQLITSLINDIIAVTIEEKDFTTNQWMQWFVTEQIEEEENVNDILDKIKLLGNSGNYYHFDNDILGMRQPAAVAQ
jgi:ferritin